MLCIFGLHDRRSGLGLHGLKRLKDGVAVPGLKSAVHSWVESGDAALG
jgi:hypothetical protein